MISRVRVHVLRGVGWFFLQSAGNSVFFSTKNVLWFPEWEIAETVRKLANSRLSGPEPP